MLTCTCNAHSLTEPGTVYCRFPHEAIAERAAEIMAERAAETNRLGAIDGFPPVPYDERDWPNSAEAQATSELIHEDDGVDIEDLSGVL